MSSLKLGPFAIFLILLIVLVISVVFSNFKWNTEGFINYNYTSESASSSLQQMIILPYSKTVKVYQVYDSIYYDVNNGSVIEFFGKQYDAAKPNTDNVLTDMFVLPRTGTNVKNYSLTSDVKTVDEAVCPNDTNSNMSNNSWVFPENANTNLNSFQYQVIYIPWGKNTILFIHDITISKKILSSTLFSNNIPTAISNMNQDILRISNLQYKTDSDSRNNTYIVEPLYDPAKSSTQFSDVFQISANVLFDVKNGYLMIRNSGKMDIYNGTSVPLFSQVDSSGKVKDTPVTMSNLKSFVLNDVDGQNIVVYIPMDSNTVMVAILTVDPNNSKLFMIRNVVRFNSSVPSGIDGKPNIEHKTSTASTTPTTKTECSSTKTESKMDFANLSLNDVISKYYQQYYGSTNGGDVPGAYSNDFLLKTQIIPPVCPSCPSCPNNVSCTNCGGTGGAGMVGAVKNTTTYYDVFGNQIMYDASKNPVLVDKTGNKITQIFDNSGNQVQFVHGHFIPIQPNSSNHNVSSSAPTTSPNTNFGGAVSSLGSSTSHLGSDIVKGTENVVTGAIGAAAGLAGTTIGTAGNIVNNAISTVGKMGQGTSQYGTGTSHDSKIYQNSRGQAGNFNGDNNSGSIGQSLVSPKGNYITTGADPATYYGAVVDRGSANFIPLTSDFSKFGR